MTSITLEEYPTVSLGKRESRKKTLKKPHNFYWLLYKPMLTLEQCLKTRNKRSLCKFTEEESEFNEQIHSPTQQSHKRESQSGL